MEHAGVAKLVDGIRVERQLITLAYGTGRSSLSVVLHGLVRLIDWAYLILQLSSCLLH
jgi:hypothetical protein